MRKLRRCWHRLSALRTPARRRHWIVAANPETIKLFGPCACCARPASFSRRETVDGGNHCVIVPYCSACLRHAARPQLLEAATLYGSLLLSVFGGILCAATWDSRWGTTLVAVTLAAAPTIWSRWLNLPRQLGHAARGKALRLLPQGIACASEAFANLVAAQSHGLVSCAVVKGSSLRPSMLLGPVLALILTPALHHLFFPSVRVVNFTDRTTRILVDDRELGRVEPTSGESPAAGVTMRAPSGRHRIQALWNDGTLVDAADVRIVSGFQHLYAPGAREDCFYLQRAAYGRSAFDGETRLDFRSPSRFWIVPSEVDLWFTPEKSMHKGATTGGVVTLLRMGQCR